MASLSHGKKLEVGCVGIDKTQLPDYHLGPPSPQSWFGPDRAGAPVELEIGCGKGTFILNQAQQHPQVNFLGLEYSRPFWAYAADRCRRHALQNVRLFLIEADYFVRNYLPAASLRQVHVYFPDPWPKKRHHKRRLIQAPFLREMARVLENGGAVRIATDHAEYFQWMLDHAAAVADLFDVLPFDSAVGPALLVGTNFELKYRREGRPFYATLLRKR